MNNYSSKLKTFAQKLRKDEIDAESFLWLRLRNRQLEGIEFKRQYTFGDFVCDFYSKELKLVIEINGHTQDENFEKDEKKEGYLELRGIKTIRFSNLEVLEKIDEVVQKILETRNDLTHRFSLENGPIRTLFVGTSSFATTILESMVDSGLFVIDGVVTQPDRPFGRKKEMMPPPLKIHLNLIKKKYPQFNPSLFQPEKLSLDAETILKKIRPELIIVAAYGQIIPEGMLNFPKYKTLNIHGSVLPKYRGAVPVHMAILNGDKVTGVSIQVMTREMDRGDVIATSKTQIEVDETTGDLMNRLASIGAELLMHSIPLWLLGKLEQVPQNDSLATYCYQKDVSKEKAQINWETMSSVQIDQMVRAFYPWPIAWFKINNQNTKNEKYWGKILKIYSIKIQTNNFQIPDNIEVGEIFEINNCLYVKTMDAIIELIEIQLEGKKRMRGKDYGFISR